MSLLLIQLLMD